MLRTKKIILLITVFLLAGIAVFTIANRSNNRGRTDVVLYFLSADKSSISGYGKEFSEESNEALYKEVAENLIKGPKNKRYTALMDKNTELKSITNENGNLTVDFSGDYPDSELLSTYAVIKTFSQLPDVKSVMVKYNGLDVLGRGFISGDEINLESDDDCAVTVHLYFADEDKQKLVGEYRKINILDTQPIEQYIIAELIKGPKLKGLTRLLPKEADIVSAETTDGTCYVNFKKSFSSKASRELMIYSIVNSLTERTSVDCVQFLIDGKKSDNDGTPDISVPLYRNETLIGIK
jgi:spore germination protein GerM